MTRARAEKRIEAEQRNARTLPQNRRAYWRDTGPDDLDTPPGPCRWPHKVAYENQAAVAAARSHMARHRKQQDLHPYYCRAGHYHLGRHTERSTVAWKAVA